MDFLNGRGYGSLKAIEVFLLPTKKMKISDCISSKQERYPVFKIRIQDDRANEVSIPGNDMAKLCQCHPQASTCHQSKWCPLPAAQVLHRSVGTIVGVTNPSGHPNVLRVGTMAATAIPGLSNTGIYARYCLVRKQWL